MARLSRVVTPALGSFSRAYSTHCLRLCPPHAPHELHERNAPPAQRHTRQPRRRHSTGPAYPHQFPAGPRTSRGAAGDVAQQQQQQRWASWAPTLPTVSSFSLQAKPPRPKTALFFPGQGVQKVGMLTPWLEAFPTTARALVDEIDELMGYKLSTVIQEGPGARLMRTEHAQPAIMATSILILRVLEREFGFRVGERIDVTLGHSLGEFAALVAGGYMAFADSLFLVRRRAEAMARATQRVRDEHGGEYGMVAVVTEPGYMAPVIEAIHKFLDGTRPSHAPPTSPASTAMDHSTSFYLKNEGLPPSQQILIANINSRNQIVLSGNIERIRVLMAQVRNFLGHDPRAVKLNADSPFHSPIMRPAAHEVRRLLDTERSRVPGREHEDVVTFPGLIPCISNVTARPFESRADLKELLARQCEETVHWWDSIRYLDQEQRVRRWVGIGPGKVGRNLVGKEVGMRGKDVIKGGGVWAITDPSEIEEVLRGLDETEAFLELEEEEEDWGERFHHH